MGLKIEPRVLKDFEEEDEFKLEDFRIEKSNNRFTLPDKSTAQIAATDVAMSEAPSLESYRGLREQLNSPEGREAFILKHHQLQMQLLDDMAAEIPAIVTDPDLSDKEKVGFIESFRSKQTDQEPPSLNINPTIMENAATEGSEGFESENEYNSSQLFLDRVTQVNEQKRDFTSRINALAAERNPNVVSKAVDIAELMVPFAEWVNVDQMSQAIGDGTDGLTGTQKQALYDSVAKIPTEKRGEFFETVVDYLETHGDVIFADGNDLVAFETLDRMFVDNNYSDLERWADNIFSVLDVAGVFAVIAKGPQILRKARKASTTSQVNPNSPSQLLKDSNPEKAERAYEVVAASDGDEAAEALYGTTKTDAMADDILPSPSIDEGVLPHKINPTSPTYREPEIIKDTRNIDASSALTDVELQKVQQRVVANLNDIEGMTPHENSMTVRHNKDGSSTYTMMYRPDRSGLKSYDEAIDNSLYSFRDFGLQESDVTIYRRNGTEWVETSRAQEEILEGVRKKARDSKKRIPDEARETDYAVGISYDYRFRPEDLADADPLARDFIFGLIPANLLSRLNLFRGSRGEGSLMQHILDPNSLMNQRVIESASTVTDRSYALRKMYIDVFEDFSKRYGKMKGDRREKLVEYINRANHPVIKFDETKLKAEGFTPDELETLKQWRRGNDILFHSTNADMVKTLRNRGYKVFVDRNSDTKLIGKPIKRGGVGPNTKYYDPAIGTLQKAANNKKELDAFYEKGGTFVRLQEPVKVEDEWVNMIRSTETPGGGYLRALADEEQVLHYREGYYPVQYDANFFVQMTFKIDGETVTKTLASAKTRQAAERQVTKLKAEHEGENVTISYITDQRLEKSNQGDRLSEEGWNVGVSSGLSAQRIRGKRLTDLDSDLYKAEAPGNLVDPLEAVSRQIINLSNKVSVRDWLDTTKRRWTQNYAAKLGFKDGKYPSSIDQLKKTSDISFQELADARDLYNYIRSMENGYINSIDEGFKALVNSGADALAKIPGAEKALRGFSRTDPSSSMRGVVFKLYLASNPARQLVVQGHQSVQLMAVNPRYFATQMWGDLTRIGKVMRGNKSDKEAVEMWEELRRSGMLEAVDSSTLTRQDMLRLADATYAQKASSAAGAPLRLAQRVGFDTGEQTVLVTSWLTHRDMAIKAGKTLDRRTYDEIAGKARAFTYNMNRSGEMPYNRNSLSVLAQFLSVPHKAFLQPFLNTSLTRQQKLQLLGWNTTVYGVPAGTFIHTYLERNVENQELREGLTRGMEQWLFNKIATAATGEQQQVDWGDLNPTNITGMGDVLVSILAGDVGELIANAPATSLFFGPNPRLTTAFKTAARYTNLVDDYDDPELNTRFTDVVTAFGSTFSGLSNSAKARYAWKTGNKLNSLGNITDEDITKFEAFMQGFGFRTLTETARFNINREINEAGSFQGTFNKSDVRVWYEELKRQLNRREMTGTEQDFSMRVMSEGMRVFEDDKPKFRNELISLIEKDAKRGEHDFITGIMRAMNWMDDTELRGLVNQIPNPKTRRDLQEMLNYSEE